MSSSTYASYESLARQVLDTGRADVVGVGALLALWTGSRATSRVLETIVIAYDIESPRPSWRRRLVALGLTIGALLGAVAVLPLLVLGPRLVKHVVPDGVASATLTALSMGYWPALGLLASWSGSRPSTTWACRGARRGSGTCPARCSPWRCGSSRRPALRAYLALSALGGADAGNAVYRQLGTPIAVGALALRLRDGGAARRRAQRRDREEVAHGRPRRPGDSPGRAPPGVDRRSEPRARGSPGHAGRCATRHGLRPRRIGASCAVQEVPGVVQGRR